MADLNPGEILVYIINFIITFVLLYLLLYQPASKFLSERKERIANSLKEAADKQLEADKILREAQAELANTGEKARRLSHEAIENAALDAERILDNAEKEAEEILEQARELIESEKQTAMERAFTELVSLAGDMASRILMREVSLADNYEIAERFFNETAQKSEEGKP